MALSDIFEVKVFGLMLSQPTLNVFHVVRAGGVIDAGNIYQGWYNTVLPAWYPLVSEDYWFQRVLVRNLGEPTDFYDVTYEGDVVAGGKTGLDNLPPHDAVTVRFNRADLSMRHGYKRFAGLVETDVINGVVETTVLNAWQDFADVMVGDWENATPETMCNLIVLQRIKDVAESSGKTIYRLPETDEELAFYQPYSALAYHQVSTQVSRKYNR